MKFLLLIFFLISSEYGYSNDLLGTNDEEHIFYYDISQSKCHHRPGGVQCLGKTLPYSSFSNRLVQYQVEDEEEKLKELETAAKFFPKCWKVIQPMLCLVFKPPCNTAVLSKAYGKSFKKPCRHLCTKVQKHCKVLMSSEVWPEFLNCDNNDIFADKHCLKPSKNFYWSAKRMCPRYLVPTSNPDASLEEFPGCRMGCHDPFYTNQEHQQMRAIIFWSATICAVINILSILTYMINWKWGTYPERALTYLNYSSLLFCVGWLLQFFPFSVEEIVCNSDDSLRTSQPLLGVRNFSDLPCLVTFVLIYFSTVAITMWFLILCLIWCLKLEAIDNRRFDKHSARFHVIGWLVPLFSTILMIYFQAIDGYSITGVCFVSPKKIFFEMSLLFWTVFLPIIIVLAVSACFILSRVISMIRFMINCKKRSLPIRPREIISTICDLITFWAVPLIAIVFSVHVHFVDSKRAELAIKLFKSNYLSCVLHNQAHNNEIDCVSRIPNIGFDHIYRQVCLIFIVGAWSSCFLWTSSTLTIWRRFFRRIFCREQRVLSKKRPTIIPTIRIRQY